MILGLMVPRHPIKNNENSNQEAHSRSLERKVKEKGTLAGAAEVQFPRGLSNRRKLPQFISSQPQKQTIALQMQVSRLRAIDLKPNRFRGATSLSYEDATLPRALYESSIEGVLRTPQSLFFFSVFP